MASAKTREAQECIDRAEKSLKTSLFKWKPDFDIAANEYQKAATAYKAGKEYEKALDCCIKAADYFQQNRQYFSAAKSFEQAALIAGKDMQKWSDAISLIEKACKLFQEHGVPDTCALVYERGAKMVEQVDPEKAAHLYALAAEVTLIESKNFQAADYAAKAARVYAKIQKYDDALKMLEKQMMFLREIEDERACGRLVVHLVLMQLIRDDIVAATKAFSDYAVFVEQEEKNTLNQLLYGFDNMDSRQIISALNHPFIKSLDIEFAKIARTLQRKHEAILGRSENKNDAEAGEQSAVDDEAGLLL